MDVTMDDILIYCPLVSEDAPEWKRVCPFCGAVAMIHEIDGAYICHECYTNWIENDTPTER